jgi:PTS system mannose-specific IID component
VSGERLRAGERLRMALRLLCLQATWNYERQQGIGWAWAIAPALKRLIPDPAARNARLAEHTAYFNTQPTMASFALGAVAALEERRAAGEAIDAAAVVRVKHALGASLAALGDRLFWFTLRPFAAMLGVLLALCGVPWAAVALWMCYNLFHLPLRLTGVEDGYRLGPAVLDQALRRRLEQLTLGLAVLGTALMGAVVAVLLVPHGEPQSLANQATLGAGLGLGYLTAQRARPSPTEWSLGLGALCLLTAWLRG